MFIRHCKTCYFGNVCQSGCACENYSPIGEFAEDAIINEAIEQEREEYREAWFTYIEE